MRMPDGGRSGGVALVGLEVAERMRAAVVPEHGDADVLRITEIETPTPGPGELLVAVHACALNHLDIFVRRGMPGKRVPLPFVTGADVAGRVAALGPGVEGPEVGTRVLLDPHVPQGALGEDVHGGLAEYVVAPARNAIPLPDDLDFVDAAALPMVFGTAWRMLITQGELKAGETVVILGASGGVGTAAVQIARLAGAYVYAVTGSNWKRDALLRLGADEVIDYRAEPFEHAIWQRTGKRGVDLVVEGTGKATWRASLRCVRKGGRIVTCGATTGYDPQTDIRYIWIREITIRGSDGWTRSELDTVLSLCFQGRLRPVLDRVVPLEEVAAAQRAMEGEELVGKIVVSIRADDPAAEDARGRE